MKFISDTKAPLPPSLSMDDYADFIEETLKYCDKSKAKLQKKIEEKITKPFCIT